jgi:hypothetical protein
MDEFSSNQFDRMLAMYDKYRAEDEDEIEPEAASNPRGIVIQNAAQVVVAQNPVVATPVVGPPPVVVPPPVVTPPSTCNRKADGTFCRRDVQCCSGDCYFRKCRPTRR